MVSFKILDYHIGRVTALYRCTAACVLPRIITYNIRTNQFLRFDVVVYVEQVGPPALVAPLHFFAHFLGPQRPRPDLHEHRAVERDHYCVDWRQPATSGGRGVGQYSAGTMSILFYVYHVVAERSGIMRFI